MRLAPLAAVIILPFALGCSSDSGVSPLGTTASASNAIQEAHVLVDGAPVEGTVMSGAHGSTLFQVRLRDRDASHLAAVQQVRLSYALPGPGMHQRTGEALCWDDGTHGDPIAGDGIYHFLDQGQQLGCGYAGAPHGTYEYTFHCEQVSGAPCGEHTLSVTRQ